MRERKGRPILEKYRADLRRKLLGDESGELETALNNMSLTVQERAKPISVATRGVGIVCSVEYSRMVTTWDLNAISEICTIYQFYRVTLIMIWYKIYLAQQVQYEPKSYFVGEDVAMPEEQRQILATIRQLPSATAGLLSTIGKVEADGKIFHSVIPSRPGDQAPDVERYWYQTLVITPDNIGRLVDELSNVHTPVAFRQLFIQHNSLPGANFNANGVLENRDDIWPPIYDLEDVQTDVHAYNNLLTRVGPRMPNHFLTVIEWGGNATESALACSDPQAIRIVSEFRVQPPVPRYRMRRDHRGRAVEAPDVPGPQLVRDRVMGGQATLHWNIGHTAKLVEFNIGIISMVGEVVDLVTRTQINGNQFVDANPLAMLYSLVDPPRSKVSSGR